MLYLYMGFGLRIASQSCSLLVVVRFSGRAVSARRFARLSLGFGLGLPGSLSGGRLEQVQYRLRVPRAGP